LSFCEEMLPKYRTSSMEAVEDYRERVEQSEQEKKHLNELFMLHLEQSRVTQDGDENGFDSDNSVTPLKNSMKYDSVPLTRVSSSISSRTPTRVTAPAFQRVILTDCPEEGADDELREIKSVCTLIEQCRSLRKKYHIPFHAPPYYGPFDSEKYRHGQAEAEETFRKYWGPMFRGRAAAIFEARYPDAPSRIVKPIASLTSTEMKEYSFECQSGVIRVSHEKRGLLDPSLPSAEDFARDMEEINRFCNSPASKSVCFKRLELLEARFNLHRIMNSRREGREQRNVSHRDFYNVRKVDCHIHHSAIMTQKHLLRFIKQKIKRCSDEIVIERHGRYLTLREVFDSLGLTAYDLSIDHLDMHADNTFHRFDRFNLKYNPVGETRLREVFLKTSNLINGRYLAEITQQVFKDLEENKYVLVEPRLSVYGKLRSEWEDLGRWYCTNRLASPNVRWMIQIPRLYSAYKSSGLISSFQELLDNIFLPLFEATLNPEQHPELDCFLNVVVGIDCVDDESKVDEPHKSGVWPEPSQWTDVNDPPYAYWIYYIYANLRELNEWRKELGKTTFSMRPHAGEAGDISHLSATYLCAESINHGVMLRKSPPLQYLYYLDQIGLAVSPLSNNSLFVEYDANPFPIFFARGLNVTLSTDDPLLLHMTKDPLVEEYSVASQVWKLSSTDMCEIARNSVLMSGLEHPFKCHYVGDSYFQPGVMGNDIEITNVPDVRVQYRHETLCAEVGFVGKNAESHVERHMQL